MEAPVSTMESPTSTLSDPRCTCGILTSEHVSDDGVELDCSDARVLKNVRDERDRMQLDVLFSQVVTIHRVRRGDLPIGRAPMTGMDVQSMTECRLAAVGAINRCRPAMVRTSRDKALFAGSREYAQLLGTSELSQKQQGLITHVISEAILTYANVLEGVERLNPLDELTIRNEEGGRR